MFKKCIKGIIRIAVISAAVFCIPVATVCAEGGINSNEARVLGVARGGFAYNNELYTARQEYVNQLISYLSRDDVNLTESQADKAISTIYANIETGVNQGYIVKKGAPEDDIDLEQEIEITEISPEEEAEGITDVDELNKATPAPGAVVYEDDGIARVYNNEGKEVVNLDGVMRNTGLSYSGPVTAGVVLSVLFGLTVTAALIYIISERRRTHGS